MGWDNAERAAEANIKYIERLQKVVEDLTVKNDELRAHIKFLETYIGISNRTLTIAEAKRELGLE